MICGGSWFAWFPVVVKDRGIRRIAWLETVWRERIVGPNGSGPYRYFA